MITDNEWDTIAKRVMALPGMISANDSSFIAEDDRDDTSYMKFMSDHGVTDDNNGNTFTAYMRAQGCTIESSRPRSMRVIDADLRKLFL